MIEMHRVLFSLHQDTKLETLFMIYKFKPLLKPTLWGSESWQISGVKDSETLVSEGPCAGMTVNQLVNKERENLLGHDTYEHFGDEFPLLIKFIDARQDLSIQVHPNDEVARRHGYPRGKTEMWYCIGEDNKESDSANVGSDSNTTSPVGSDSNGSSPVDSAVSSGLCVPKPALYCGLRRHITPEEYKQRVADGTITDVLARYEVSDGDVFFIPAGRIHAIGAGCRVAEIQQTSDVTYRIYDYMRRDKDGNLRQLHTEKAAEAIDYDVQPDYRTHYEACTDEPCHLVRCPYFTTAVYDLTSPMTLDYSELDSFVVLVCLNGTATIVADDSTSTVMHAGETILLPATTREVAVEGKVKFLETFV